MRMKSVAFGALELVGEIIDLTVKEDWLIMNVRTTTPAGWTLSTALTRADLWKMMRLLCKPSVLWYILFGFGKPRDKERSPEY